MLKMIVMFMTYLKPNSHIYLKTKEKKKTACLYIYVRVYLYACEYMRVHGLICVHIYAHVYAGAHVRIC